MGKFGLLFLLLATTSLGCFKKTRPEHFSIRYDAWVTADSIKQVDFSLTLTVSKKLARVDLNSMSSTELITDELHRKALELKMFRGDARALVIKQEFYHQFEELNAGTNTQPKLSPSEKQILGYNCELAQTTSPSGNDVSVWYTKELAPINRASGYSFYLNGMPLEITVGKVSFKAAEISLEKPDEKLFEMTVPQEYKEMTFEEYLALKKPSNSK